MTPEPPGLRSWGSSGANGNYILRQTLGLRSHSNALFDLAATKARNPYIPKGGCAWKWTPVENSAVSPRGSFLAKRGLQSYCRAAHDCITGAWSSRADLWL